jgi:hypothetical protein
MRFLKKYLPNSLSNKDKKTQKKELSKSKKYYKKKRYHTRKFVSSYKSKTSHHINKAKQMYGVSKIIPNKTLAQKTKCSLSALRQIVKKGKGAYYSSGSRPNQTSHSWANARLASAITGGKASLVDYHILKKGCKKTSKALRLAKKTQKHK